MPKTPIRDDFYPGASIYRNFRRSPEAVVNLYRNLLKTNGFSLTAGNLRIVLYASRDLYRVLGEESKEEIKRSSVEVSGGNREVRGSFIPQLDLAYAILVQVLEYVRNHPTETLNAGTSLVILEDFVERKLGKRVGKIWRKIIVTNRNSRLRHNIRKLFILKRRSAKKRKKAVKRKISVGRKGTKKLVS